MSAALIRHVEEHGLRETYAELAARFGLYKSQVSTSLQAAGLAPGGGRAVDKPVTINAFPWGDE